MAADPPPLNYWNVIAAIWAATASPHEQYDEWQRVWRDAEAQAKLAPEIRAELMDDDEYATYQAMPQRVTIYRVFGGDDWRGHSWSLDRERADGLARRDAAADGPRRVARATIARNRVIALFNRRGKREVIVVPDGLDVTVEGHAGDAAES